MAPARIRGEGVLTTSNVWWALALPALGCLICALLGRTGRKGWAGYVASVAVGGAFFVALGGFAYLLTSPLIGAQRAVTVPLWDWVKAGDLSVSFTLLVDPLSMLMLLIITGVGTLIHVYAIGYMAGD